MSSGELSKITDKINDNTIWNKICIALVLVSLVILIFIISSQREAKVKLLTRLGILVTVIPTLINLLPAISGVNKKPVS